MMAELLTVEKLRLCESMTMDNGYFDFIRQLTLQILGRGPLLPLLPGAIVSTVDLGVEVRDLGSTLPTNHPFVMTTVEDSHRYQGFVYPGTIPIGFVMAIPAERFARSVDGRQEFEAESSDDLRRLIAKRNLDRFIEWIHEHADKDELIAELAHKS